MLKTANYNMMKHVLKGESAEGSNFRYYNYEKDGGTEFAYNHAYLVGPWDTWDGRRTWFPSNLMRLFNENHENITQVVYSFATPIFWFHKTGEDKNGNSQGVWVNPAISYSGFTGRHKNTLWKLDTELIPVDCGLEEYLRVVNKKMRFIHHPEKNYRLSPVPGPKWTLN